MIFWKQKQEKHNKKKHPQQPELEKNTRIFEFFHKKRTVFRRWLFLASNRLTGVTEVQLSKDRAPLQVGYLIWVVATQRFFIFNPKIGETIQFHWYGLMAWVETTN